MSVFRMVSIAGILLLILIFCSGALTYYCCRNADGQTGSMKTEILETISLSLKDSARIVSGTVKSGAARLSNTIATEYNRRMRPHESLSEEYDNI